MLHTLRFFSLQNAVYFIMLPFFGSCVIHILYTGCAKIKKKSGSKGFSFFILTVYSFCLVIWVKVVSEIKKNTVHSPTDAHLLKL